MSEFVNILQYRTCRILQSGYDASESRGGRAGGGAVGHAVKVKKMNLYHRLAALGCFGAESHEGDVQAAVLPQR